MQAVIVSFDSLASCALGCYGNEWVETPHWDELAAVGVVFDGHFADSVGPSAGRTWFTGLHALTRPDQDRRWSLGSELRAAGVTSRMIVEEHAAVLSPPTGFDAMESVSGQEGDDALPDQVPFAQLVKAGVKAWNDPAFGGAHRLLWLHSAGPGTPPSGFEALYFEDFEERGLSIESLSEDQQAAHPAIYAGSVSLIDHWLGELIDGLNLTTSSEPTLLILTSARGKTWPQLGSFRTEPSPVEKFSLSDAQTRAPLMIWPIGHRRQQEFCGYRSNHLVQTCDMIPTLFDWFGVEFARQEQALSGLSWLSALDQQSPARSHLWIGDEGRFDAIRTADWLCIRDHLSSPGMENTLAPLHVALFQKPDDPWDVNDIAAQQPEIVLELVKRFPPNVA